MVEEEFGPVFQAAGCKVICGDNDKKLHSVVTTKLFLFPIDFEMSASKMLGQNSELMFGLEQEWWLIENLLLRKQILTKHNLWLKLDCILDFLSTEIFK